MNELTSNQLWVRAHQSGANITKPVNIKLLDPKAKVPEFKTTGAAGADITSVEEVVLNPGEFRAVGCGFALALPSIVEAQIRPRSGLAFKHGITVLNSPGTIDSDYRGEVKVILINHGSEPFHVKVGDRIAQMVISLVVGHHMEVVEDLDDTNRGEGGFGSTGTD